MPNGPDIVANAADGTKHHFPAGTDMAIVDAAMKRYASGPTPTIDHQTALPMGSYQSRKGGPVLNTNESPLRAGVTAAERGFGISKSPESYGEGYKQALGSFGDFLSKSYHELDPISTGSPQYGPIVQAALGIPHTMARGFEGMATGLEGAVKDIAGGWDRHDPRSVASGVGSLVPLKAATMGGESPEGGMVRGTVREVMGEGPSKTRLLADQHAHALATQEHLTGLRDAVHSDAQSAMSSVLSKVDEAHPEGVFTRGDIQAQVSDAMGELVKVPEKMPSSVAKIMAKPKGGAFLDTPGGAVSVDKLTAEQLKQFRSDVGQELGRYGKKGVIGAALNRVYGILSDELRGAAKDAGVEKDWLQANDKYSQYATDFVRGPMKRVFSGGTASAIMEPLTGNARVQMLDLLQKYRDAGFNVDMDTLGDEMRRYSMSRTVNRLSQPTKMDLLMAGFSPKALAIRQLGPRLMRNPKAIDFFAGEGFEPKISPKQVYPTKAAAMAGRGGEARAVPDVEESDIEQAIRQRGSTRRAVEPTEEEVKGSEIRAERKAAEEKIDKWLRGRKKEKE